MADTRQNHASGAKKGWLRAGLIGAATIGLAAATLPAGAFAQGAPRGEHERGGERHGGRAQAGHDQRGHASRGGESRGARSHTQQQRNWQAPRQREQQQTRRAEVGRSGNDARHGSGSWNRGERLDNAARGNAQRREYQSRDMRGGDRARSYDRAAQRARDERRGDARRGDDRRAWNAQGNERYRGNDHYRGNERARGDVRVSRGGSWNRGEWRRDNRYNWRAYRGSHRSIYRPGRYYAPYRGYSYRRIGIGFSLGSMFYGQRYWIDDPWYYRLPPVYGPYRWVRYYDDVLLVNVYTGRVADVIYGFFY